MKVCSLFSGIGGFDLGFEQAGLPSLVQVEFNAQCRSLLRSKFPTASCISDVLAIPAIYRRLRQGYSVPNHESWQRLIRLISECGIICGGFPCQDLSVAGRRAGLAGERSGLWFVFRRIVALFRPAWVVIENVPGLLSSNGGRDLAVILRGLEKLGYRWAYRTLDAQFFGLAQRRERVFIVASLGTFRCAEVLFERESVCGNHPPSRETREEVAGTLGSRTEGGGMRTTDIDGHGAYIVKGPDGAIAGTVRSKWAKGSGGSAGDECQNIVAGTLNPGGHPGSYNGQDAYSGNLIAHTLRAEGFDASEDGTGRGTPLVCAPLTTNVYADRASEEASLIAFSHCDNGQDAGEIAPTLRARKGVKSNDAGSGQVSIAYRTAGNCGPFEQGDKTAALNTATDPNQNIILGSGVRRLTPVECERLQGFPVRWTEEFADSVRYRMLGNAVAVPCARWIGQRIRRLEEGQL